MVDIELKMNFILFEIELIRPLLSGLRLFGNQINSTSIWLQIPDILINFDFELDFKFELMPDIH